MVKVKKNSASLARLQCRLLCDLDHHAHLRLFKSAACMIRLLHRQLCDTWHACTQEVELFQAGPQGLLVKPQFGGLPARSSEPFIEVLRLQHDSNLYANMS